MIRTAKIAVLTASLAAVIPVWASPAHGPCLSDRAALDAAAARLRSGMHVNAETRHLIADWLESQETGDHGMLIWASDEPAAAEQALKIAHVIARK